jgi:hypothetical protein
MLVDGLCGNGGGGVGVEPLVVLYRRRPELTRTVVLTKFVNNL